VRTYRDQPAGKRPDVLDDRLARDLRWHPER